MERIILSWNNLNDIIQFLTQYIQKQGERYDGVYGIPRGGLILAVILSHRLKLPLLMAPSNNSLVVDDISDTGETLRGIKHKKIVTIYTTSWTITKPDIYYDYKLKRESWIIFPWEADDEGL